MQVDEADEGGQIEEAAREDERERQVAQPKERDEVDTTQQSREARRRAERTDGLAHGAVHVVACAARVESECDATNVRSAAHVAAAGRVAAPTKRAARKLRAATGSVDRHDERLAGRVGRARNNDLREVAIGGAHACLGALAADGEEIEAAVVGGPRGEASQQRVGDLFARDE